jgi:murein DD-endopeptidase MepM/ murein hydrolase activator NlpD
MFFYRKVCKNNAKNEENFSCLICIFYHALDRLQKGGVHMDKRMFDKSSNFFKKEGFYVVLFVCLCVVATVAAVTARSNRLAKIDPPVAEQPKDKGTDVAVTTDDNKTNPDNALQVNKETPSGTITVPKDGSAAVSKTVDTKFSKPVSGVLAREYTTDVVYCSTIDTWKTVNGIDIIAAAGTKVVAVLDGKVEKVENDKTELGQYVVINHQNGLKTIYANLDEKLSANIKVGAMVKKDQQIGVVGSTRGSFSEEDYGTHLHFQVMKGNAYENPAKHLTYELAKKK